METPVEENGSVASSLIPEPLTLGSRRFCKLLCVLDTAIVLLALVVIVRTPPAQGYEISMYRAFPWFLWIALAIPILMMFLTANDRLGLHRSDAFVFISCALTALFTFLSLPLLRGYYFYSGGDALTHLGLITQISETSHVGHTNIYPIIHIWILSTAEVSQSNIRQAMLLTPQFLTLFYVASMFILSRTLKLSPKQSILVAGLAIMPLFRGEHIGVFPSSGAFFMVPITLSVLIKSKSVESHKSLEYSTILVVLLILFPFFHPEASLFLIVILAVFSSMGRRPVQRGSGKEMSIRWRSKSTPVLVLGTAFALWFSASVAFGATVKTIYESLVSNSGTSPIAEIGALVSRANVQPRELVVLFVLGYAAIAVVSSLAMASAVRMVIRVRLKERIPANGKLLMVLFVLFSAFLVLFMVRDLVIGQRPMKYLLLVSVILAAGELCRLLTRESVVKLPKMARLASASLVVTMLLVITFCSLLNTYPSPATKQFNWQTTQEEFSGMEFFFEDRDQRMLTMEITVSQMRFADALLGIDAIKKNLMSGEQAYPEKHFGYANGSSLGDFYTEDRYLLFNSLTEKFYPEVYPEFVSLWRYQPSDFERMRTDSSINLICENGGFSMYYIVATSPKT